MATTQRNGSIPFIDWMRAAAPTMVLWAHLGPMPRWLAGDKWPILNWTQSIFDALRIMEEGGHLGVLLFFLVSGFIISHVADNESRAEFAIKRAFRIFPMLICGVILAFLLSQGTPGPKFSYRDVLLSVSLLDNVIRTEHQLLYGITWSLVTEVSFYAMMIALFDQMKRSPIVSTYLLISIVYALQIVLCSVLGDSISAVYFLKQVLFIMVGRVAYLVWSGRASRLNGVILAGAALAALTASDLLTPYSRSQFIARDSVAFSWFYAVVIFVSAMALSPRRTPSAIRFLSDVSYSSYLLHFPMGILLISVLSPVVGVATAFFVTVASVYAVSFVTHQIVEVPGQKLGRLICSWAARPRMVAAVAAN